MNFGYSFSFKMLDKGLIEQFGPTGFAISIFNFAFNITAVQTGLVYHVIFLFLLGFCFYFFSYFLLSFGIIFSLSNAQLLIFLFGYLLFVLSENF